MYLHSQSELPWHSGLLSRLALKDNRKDFLRGTSDHPFDVQERDLR